MKKNIICSVLLLFITTLNVWATPPTKEEQLAHIKKQKFHARLQAATGFALYGIAAYLAHTTYTMLYPQDQCFNPDNDMILEDAYICGTALAALLATNRFEAANRTLDDARIQELMLKRNS